jgi:hypothetical protein
MLIKKQYFTKEEREQILNEYNQYRLKEEQNIIDGNFLIFTRLLPNKDFILADGKDTVTFRVITDEPSIDFIVNNEEPVTVNTENNYATFIFTTTTLGKITITAQSNLYGSDSFTIDAVNEDSEIYKARIAQNLSNEIYKTRME